MRSAFILPGSSTLQTQIRAWIESFHFVSHELRVRYRCITSATATTVATAATTSAVAFKRLDIDLFVAPPLRSDDGAGKVGAVQCS